ncbi:pimeloyl-ACP methyl ester carboxylesterase [Chitinophaga niastensis]|uniref:Pimeloyl-ACP methyl ester carboxylesterase n=1 Tax=Chitinophaga niastensis TaxID=536980 RepID=A0A2P8HC91_CHINA|nr:alpha/beta hydrolase [Chitinophaga niastensis]PSL43855.1 pimeloyl-ACP methyl ester carboxylesterase [Chitinophaga niastensis]
MNKVISKDGTTIVYDKTGNGPAVILVDGAFCSRNFGPMPKLTPLLAKSFTVFTYDRRARGDSGDTQPYAIQREIEDIDALIKVAGGFAYLFGISSGAVLCIKAVASGLNITKLALFEPPFNIGSRQRQPPADGEEQLTKMIAAHKKSDAVKFYLTKVIGLPAIVPFIMQLTPNWSKMKANANSLPYDAAIMGNFLMPIDQVSAVKVPTIVIDSEKSPEALRKPAQVVAETLPNAQRRSLKGQVHNVPPEVLAPVLVDFYNN